LRTFASEKCMECLKSHNSVNFIASGTVHEAQYINAEYGFPKSTTNDKHGPVKGSAYFKDWILTRVKLR